MTIEQEKHLARIKANFVIGADSKYRKGQQEHGGNLFDRNALALLNAAIEEAIDMVIYLETMRENLINELNSLHDSLPSRVSK